MLIMTLIQVARSLTNECHSLALSFTRNDVDWILVDQYVPIFLTLTSLVGTLVQIRHKSLE